MSMFHVKRINLHQSFFLLLLFTLPFQTRILYWAEQAYIDGYFSYQKAIFLYFTDIIFGLTFISWLFHKPYFQKKAYLIYIFAFLLLSGTSLFHVEHINLGLYSLIKWMELMVLIIVAHETIKTVKYYTLASLTIFTSALLQAFVAITQFHVQHSVGLSFLGEYIAPLGTAGLATIDTPAEKLIRAYGTFPHPNVLGAFLVFGLIMGLFYVSRETLKTNRFSGTELLVSCGTIILTIAIFLTFSRIAWAGAGLSLFAFLLFHVKRKRHHLAIAIVIISIVSCGTIIAAYGSLLKIRTAELSNQSNSFVLRETFNSQAQNILAKNPIIGVGLGNFIPTLEKEVSLEPWQYQPAHNILIHVATETGIIGLSLFVLIFIASLRSTWNNKTSLFGFTSLVLGIVFITMGQFDHYFVTIQQGRLMFFTTIGIMLAAGSIKDDNIVANNETVEYKPQQN